MPDASAIFAPEHPVDLRQTLRMVAQGRFDPMVRLGTSGAWRSSRTPEGPATLWLRAAGRGRQLRAEAWGPGAAWAVAQAPELVGGTDVIDGFEDLARQHPLVADLHHRHRWLRLPRTRRVFESMVVTICAQKVTGIEAKRSYRGIVRTWGERAPVPAGVPDAPKLCLLPEPAVLARQPSWAFHPLGLERKRAETLLRMAAAAASLEQAADMDDRVIARRRLRAVPGIGVWTSAEVALVALGDADAVSVGDYHLPNVASWHLAGEPRGSDERMLELLEPYRPHRGRVLRLLEMAGGAPRYGPRMPLSHLEAR